MAQKTISVLLTALTSSYKAKMAEATATTKMFGNSVLSTAKQNQGAFTTMGIGAIAFAGGIGFALKAAADAAIDFESSFAGVRKTVDATEPEFAAMAQGLRDMAKEIPVNVNELNRIAEAAGQLGIAKGAILDFTKTVAELGVTTNLSTDDAANALARIANIMQTPQNQLDRIGATIVALGNAGASTEADIVEFGLRIAGAGQIAGLAESDILAIGNAMSSVGVEAEAGGTAVQKVLIEITQAVATGSPKLAQFAAAAGMSADGFTQAWKADPAQAFTAFVEGLGGAGKQAIAILQALGLTDQRLIRSFLSLAGSGDVLRKSVDLGSQSWKDNTALVEEAAKRFDTTASKIQIAKNRINDAAISFGQILLPAIAAVIGVFGQLAGAIDVLPGPVKALAIALGIAAAGMALLAGAALLLAPKIALVQAAFTSAGVSTGLFAGSLQYAAKAITPWTLAIAAATIGISIWASKAAEAKRRNEELRATLNETTGAITQMTRAWIANRLEQDGVLTAASRLGIASDTLTSAILGQADSVDHVNRALEEHARDTDAAGRQLNPYQTQINKVRDALGSYTSDLTEQQAAQRRVSEATGEQTDATNKAGDAAKGAKGSTEDLTGAVDDYGNVAEEAKSITDQFTDALKGLAGTALDTEESAIHWRNALADLVSELKDGTKTLDINTAAGRENRQSIVDTIQAAQEHAAAVAEETGSVERGFGVFQSHISQLIEEARRAGISEKAIKDYIAQLHLTPKEIRTLLTAVVGPASAKVLGFKRLLEQLPSSVSVDVLAHIIAGGARSHPPVKDPVGHAGGVVGALGARRLHGGGNIRGDEEWFVGQRGERVLSAAQMRVLRSITGAGAAAPSSFGSGSHRDAQKIEAQDRLAAAGRGPVHVVVDRPVIVGNANDFGNDNENIRHDRRMGRAHR